MTGRHCAFTSDPHRRCAGFRPHSKTLEKDRLGFRRNKMDQTVENQRLRRLLRVTEVSIPAASTKKLNDYAGADLGCAGICAGQPSSWLISHGSACPRRMPGPTRRRATSPMPRACAWPLTPRPGTRGSGGCSCGAIAVVGSPHSAARVATSLQSPSSITRSARPSSPREGAHCSDRARGAGAMSC